MLRRRLLVPGWLELAEHELLCRGVFRHCCWCCIVYELCMRRRMHVCGRIIL